MNLSASRSPRSILSTRTAIAAAGTLAASASLFGEIQFSTAMASALIPAIYMVLTLLSGWHLATASSIALTGIAWMAGGGHLAAEAVAVSALAVLCGESLRQGINPLYICVPLMLACLLGEIPPFTNRPLAADLRTLADATIQTGTNAALATMAFMLMPRRSTRLASRTRVRLDHIVFAIVVGTGSLASFGMLVDIGHPATDREWADAVANRLAVAAIIALAASAILSSIGRKAFRSLATAHKDTSRNRSARRLPLELVSTHIKAARKWKALRRDADASRRELLKTQRKAHQTEQELRKTTDALRQRWGELRKAVAGGADIRARYEALMSGTPAAVLYTDASGMIRHANRATTSLLGFQSDGLQGKSIGILIPDEHILDHPLSTVESGQLAATPRIMNCRIQTQDGTSREVAVQILPFTVRETEHRLVLLREADTTRRALAALEQARKLTQSGQRSRDMFIATMSHEMRTPLHGLIATLDMLRSSESGEDFQHQLMIARSSARALLKIANDVLDFTRIGSSQFTLDRRLFGMTGILREVVEEAQARATSLGLTLSAELPKDLPASFMGDANRIKQILGNLVSNALKFTSHGSVALKVDYDGRQCTIDVSDSGEGIPQDKRERIFEPFVQAQSRARGQIGTGLGLPISRRLAEAMGGELVLLRSGADGSTFRLTLHLEASDELPPEEQSLRVFSNPRGRILVVEDNAANRYVAQALLTGLECPATIVESGAEALELLRHQEFDLILMDCQMPEMDGYEVTRWARRILKKRVPIIAMTANAMATDRKNCQDAGMDDFLAKPFDRKALNDILCKWLAASAPQPTNPADPAERQRLLPDLDIGVLDELWESLQWRSEPLNQIRTTFNDSLRPILPLLKVGGPAERSTLLRHLHTLLGSSGMVGARQVEHLAGDLRHSINEGRYDLLPETAGELERAMLRYNREFDRWLKRDNTAERNRPKLLAKKHAGR